MAASNGPKGVHDGLVFAYDTGNDKSYKGEPTFNWIDSQNAVSQASYNPWTGPGDQSFIDNHPDAIIAYNADGGQLAGYYNGGVTDPTNAQHAHWMVDPILEKPVVQMLDITGSWQAKSFNLGRTPTQLGLTHGDSYTISWLQWSDVEGKSADTGLYQSGFHDGRSNNNTGQIVAGVWERKSYTFTLSVNFDLGANVSIYMYGHYSPRGTLRIADVQFETKGHATPLASPERTVTEGLLDQVGGATIDLSNVSFDSNADITFDGTDDAIQVPDSNLLDITSDASFEFIVKAESTQSNPYPRLLDKSVYLVHLSQTAPFSIAQNINTTSGLRQVSVGSAFPADTWTHVITTYDGQVGKIYVNGVLVNSTDFGSELPCTTNGTALKIGGDGGTGRPLNGKIATTKIYNKALTAQEVKQNYNAIKGRFGI